MNTTASTESADLKRQIRAARNKIKASAHVLFDGDPAHMVHMPFSRDRKHYRLGSMVGTVQQIEPNYDTTCLAFTVEREFYMNPHSHPYIKWESVMVLEGKCYIDLRRPLGLRGYKRVYLGPSDCIQHPADKLHGFGGDAGVRVLVAWTPRLPNDITAVDELPGLTAID